jgi:hypothetical protein
LAQLTLKRAPIGPNLEDYDVLADGAVVGHIMRADAAGPLATPWMVDLGKTARRRTAMSPTREAAMAAFAKSWWRDDRKAREGR